MVMDLRTSAGGSLTDLARIARSRTSRPWEADPMKKLALFLVGLLLGCLLSSELAHADCKRSARDAGYAEGWDERSGIMLCNTCRGPIP